MSETWDQESTKMAPKKGPKNVLVLDLKFYSDFTVCTERQHLGLNG